LRALPAVVRKFPDARLILVGRGPELERLEAIVQELGLAASVVFLGYRGDIPNVIAALDIVMLASLEEGFGLAMVEAMAFEKPILATRVGGVPEVVADGVTGLLVPPADSGALSDALVTLLGDPVLRASLGEAGRRRAEEKFTIARLAKDYEAVWSEALASSH
jgi:glycosyltransferase involved in cell wall biosynthesis